MKVKSFNLLNAAILYLLSSLYCNSQDLVNQYEYDPTVNDDIIPGTISYEGEFQIFLDRFYLTQPPYNLTASQFSYDFELVSFPFQTLPTFPDDERILVLPDPATLQTWSCGAYGWASSIPGFDYALQLKISGDFNGGPVSH